MHPRLTFITLGVQNLDRALTFYKDGLGWQDAGKGGFHYFQLGTIRLALYPLKDLAADANLPFDGQSPSQPFPGFALAHNVASPEEVDALLLHLPQFGAQLLKAGSETFWGGYSGYFRDTEGYVWEVAWNPFLPLD